MVFLPEDDEQLCRCVCAAVGKGMKQQLGGWLCFLCRNAARPTLCQSMHDRVDCDLNVTVLARIAAHQNGYCRLDKQYTCAWSHPMVHGHILVDVLCCCSQPCTDDDQLANSWLRRCIQRSPRANVLEVGECFRHFRHFLAAKDDRV